jgi:hypothetical protein
MDQIINWFLIVLILVFDPLAIALVIAANFAFKQLQPVPVPPTPYDPNQHLNSAIKVDQLIVTSQVSSNEGGEIKTY